MKHENNFSQRYLVSKQYFKKSTMRREGQRERRGRGFEREIEMM